MNNPWSNSKISVQAKKIHFIFIFVFLILFIPSLLTAKPDIIKGKFGVVSVTYSYSAKEMKSGLMELYGLKNTIDLNKYSKPFIRIEVSVLELRSGYYIKICNSCIQENYYGFSKSNIPRKVLKSEGDKSKIQYVYNEENLTKSLDKNLRISLQIFDNRGLLHEEKSSQNYRLTLSKGNATPTPPPTPSPPSVSKPESKESMLPALSLELENAIARDDKTAILKVCQEVDVWQNKKLSSKERKLLSRIVKKCEKYDIDELVAQSNQKRAFISPPDQLEKTVKEGKEDLLENKTKLGVIDIESTQIKANFSISQTDFKQLEKSYSIKIIYRNHRGREVRLIGIPKYVKRRQATSNNVTLIVPNGKKFKLTAHIPGIIEGVLPDQRNVEFISDKEQESKVDEENSSSFSVTCDETASGSIFIKIKGGVPPFEMRIIDTDSAPHVIMGIIKLGVEREVELSASKIAQEIQATTKKYRLQVFDETGDSIDDAICRPSYLVNGIDDNSWQFLLGIFVLLAAVYGGFKMGRSNRI